MGGKADQSPEKVDLLSMSPSGGNSTASILLSAVLELRDLDFQRVQGTPRAGSGYGSSCTVEFTVNMDFLQLETASLNMR